MVAVKAIGLSFSVSLWDLLPILSSNRWKSTNRLEKHTSFSPSCRIWGIIHVCSTNGVGRFACQSLIPIGVWRNLQPKEWAIIKGMMMDFDHLPSTCPWTMVGNKDLIWLKYKPWVTGSLLEIFEKSQSLSIDWTSLFLFGVWYSLALHIYKVIKRPCEPKWRVVVGYRRAVIDEGSLNDCCQSCWMSQVFLRGCRQ